VNFIKTVFWEGASSFVDVFLFVCFSFCKFDLSAHFSLAFCVLCRKSLGEGDAVA